MRILLVTETLIAGGAETFVIRLANSLASSHSVTVAVLHGEMVNSEIAAKTSPGVCVERLLLPGKSWLFKVDTLLRRTGIDWSINHFVQRRWLAALIGRVAPAIIHSHLLKADRVASEARAAWPELRHVVTLHGDYAPFLRGDSDPQMLQLAKRMKHVMERSDAVAAICREQVDFVASNFPKALVKTHLVYNGFVPWPGARAINLQSTEHTLIFGMVSRGVERKGWAKAIAAFAALPSGTAELVLVGDGPYLDALRKEKIPDGVRFVGFSPDPIEWIKLFNVGLLPTEFPYESLPTAVMEYLFCEKPVIATDVGEIGEMLRAPNGDSAGTLISYDGDRICTNHLAAAMKAYLDDPDLRRRHAALAPAAFAKFDMGACAKAYARIYAELSGSDASNSSISASH